MMPASLAGTAIKKKLEKGTNATQQAWTWIPAIGLRIRCRSIGFLLALMRYCSMKLLQMHRQPFHLASDFGGLQRAILAAMNYHTRKHAGRIDSKKKVCST